MKRIKLSNKTVRGVRTEALPGLLISGILLAVSYFLPLVRLPEQSLSFFAVIAGTFHTIVDGGVTVRRLGVLLALTLPAALAAGAAALAALRTTKGTVRFSVAAYTLSTVTAVVLLFSAAKVVNASGQMETPFLVKNLGAGFWLYLAAGVAGLASAMHAAKKSPGYIVLTVMAVVWLFPILWVIMISFRAEPGSYTSTFFPKTFTLKNYVNLFADSSQFQYARWFGNTLFVAVCSCLLSTFIVLSTAYTLSRVEFRARRPFMNVLLILGMFPGFMSMIAVYYILKGMGITRSLIALILVYSGGGAMGYYIAKGFFDTIPRTLDEAAFLDGATKWQVFTRITIPLSKPIIIYTMLTSFMGPWADYIFARVIMGDNYKNYTVALGLYMMLEKSYIETWYTRFAAGAVMISVPIAALFIALQKYYVEGLSGSVKG